MNIDRLKDDLGRQGSIRWTDRGASYDRQPSDEWWYAPEKVELVQIDGSELPALGWVKPTLMVSSSGIDLGDANLPVGRARDDGQLFDRFLRLSLREDGDKRRFGELEPEAVRDFVARYGVPSLCAEHRVPVLACATRGTWNVGSSCWPLEPLPVEEVCRLSAQVRSILTLSVALNGGERGAPSQWKVLFQDLFQEEKPDERVASLMRSKGWMPHRQLANFVNIWLDYGALSPRLDWTEDGPKKVLFPINSLYGAIARHLFLLICGDTGIALCAGCGDIFVPPNRKPKRGQNSWCPGCGKGSGYKKAKALSNALKRDT